MSELGSRFLTLLVDCLRSIAYQQDGGKESLFDYGGGGIQELIRIFRTSDREKKLWMIVRCMKVLSLGVMNKELIKQLDGIQAKQLNHVNGRPVMNCAIRNLSVLSSSQHDDLIRTLVYLLNSDQEHVIACAASTLRNNLTSNHAFNKEILYQVGDILILIQALIKAYKRQCSIEPVLYTLHPLFDEHTNAENSRNLIHANCVNSLQPELIDHHNLAICDDLLTALMRYEKNRLRTFHNWPLSYITPRDLAKAGFYFLLDSDRVRCFECKIVLFNWEFGDLAIIEHYKNSPMCKLLKGYNVGNVPIDRSPLDLLNKYIDFEVFRPVQPSEDILSDFEDDLAEVEELNDFSATAVRFNSLRIESPSSEDHNKNQQQASFTEEQLFQLMKSETKRLKTFDTWPEPLIDKVKPSDLAQCGFFYTAIRDKVICAFCKTPVWDWVDTDVPVKEHYKHNSLCPLLNDLECGNEPIKNIKFQNLLLDYQDIPPSYSSSFSGDNEINLHYPFLHNSHHNQTSFSPPDSHHYIYSPSHHSRLEQAIDDHQFNEKLANFKYIEQTIHLHKPAVKYYTHQSRLQTFDKWPHESVKPRKLTDAGFYYLGFNDQVECYSCGLILSDWSADDDPWIEHCKFSSECEYLKLNEGNDFIENSPKAMVTCSGSTASSIGRLNYDEDIKHICKMCMDKEANVLLLPCNHLAICASCTMIVKDCPVCKKRIFFTLKVYIC